MNSNATAGLANFLLVAMNSRMRPDDNATAVLDGVMQFCLHRAHWFIPAKSGVRVSSRRDGAGTSEPTWVSRWVSWKQLVFELARWSGHSQRRGLFLQRPPVGWHRWRNGLFSVTYGG